MKASALISAAYLETQRKLHATPRGYGARGGKWAETVLAVVADLGASSVLDYGCGQGSLGRELRARKPAHVRVDEYDPAISGKDRLPSFADVVVCTDVLEHIEPDRLDAVLDHLKSLARIAVFLVVNLRVASKTLCDGRNAHLIVQPAEWWRERVEAAGFAVMEVPNLPLASSLIAKPEKQKKCWIAVVRPC